MRGVSVWVSPPEHPLHSGDAHAIHHVPGQPEGNRLRGGQDLALLKGHAFKEADRTETQ